MTGASKPKEMVSATHLHFTERTELFLEHPPLVKGQEARFAVHLTHLSTFRPVTEGTVVVSLRGPAGEARGEQAAPKSPGIYGVSLVPGEAGEVQLRVSLASGGADVHEVGAVKVLVGAEEEATAAGAEGGGIPFLKEQQWATDFRTDVVAERPLRASLAATAQLRTLPERDLVVRSPAPGRVVEGNEPFPRLGSAVRVGQPLAALAPQVGGDVDRASLDLEVAQAQSALNFSQREREREEKLLAGSLTTEREVALARRDEADAEARLKAARARRSQLTGAQRASGAGASTRVVLASPLAGVLLSIDATPGAYVDQGGALFRVADLSRLLLEVRVPEADLPRAQGVNGAAFRLLGETQERELPLGALIERPVTIDPAARVGVFRFEVPNGDGALRAGALAIGRLLLGESKPCLAIPRSALIDEDDRSVVFVQTDGESFERRVVRVGVRDGAWVEVTQGLAAGERLVTRGAYEIRLASAAGTVPEHGHVH